MRFKKVLLADPSGLSREGLKSILGGLDLSLVFSEAANEEQFAKAIRQRQCFDLILVHESLLSVGECPQVTSYLYSTSSPILILCGELTPGLNLKIKCFGAEGVIRCNDPLRQIEARLFTALAPDGIAGVESLSGVDMSDAQDLKSGAQTRMEYLTDKQSAVLHYLRAGLMNKEIAYEMGIQECTVKRHVSDILKKLQMKNRIQLIASLTY
ncbi:helix-turn-helix domain-containing protein [Neptuniibacter halophilus]|uniref:helix-turn-helix domain-containing protein n=1 Tax=Neptuniibacter halophilus TaxID=651666 RepID=UPI0025725D2F|nr:response regulator transcription factor [Neptuniibacter halophilus]